jgi:periplasmic copper chaperone A
MSRLSLTLAAACLAFSTIAAQAQETIRHGDLVITQPWSREMPPGAMVQGGFLTIENRGKVDERLFAVSAEISKTMEIHEMAMTAGVMTMRELPQGLEIKAGQKMELKPGSYHVMFMGRTKEPKAGETFKATVRFETAGPLELTFKVAPLGAKSAGQLSQAPGAAMPMMDHPHQHHDHHGHGAAKPN